MITSSFRITDLLHAVIRGDLSTLMDTVTTTNVNYADPQYRLSLVMWAVALGRLPTVELLLSRGASLSQVDRYGFTILHRAVWAADVPTIHMVLFYSPLHRHPSSNSRSSSSSAHNTWRQGAQRLVNAVHAATGRTPLMLAAVRGHADVVRYLLETCCADPFQKDAHGFAAIDLAALCGHTHVVRLLLQHTVAPNGDNSGEGAADVYPTTQCSAEEYCEIASTVPQRQRLCAVNQLLNDNLAEASRVAAA